MTAGLASALLARSSQVVAAGVVAAISFVALDWLVGPRLRQLDYEMRLGPAFEILDWRPVSAVVARGATSVNVHYRGVRHREAANTINGFWYVDDNRSPWLRMAPIAGGYSVSDGAPRDYVLTIGTPSDGWPPVGAKVCYEDITTSLDDPTPPIRTPRICWRVVAADD